MASLKAESETENYIPLKVMESNRPKSNARSCDVLGGWKVMMFFTGSHGMDIEEFYLGLTI